jgi:hypothetical protein
MARFWVSVPELSSFSTPRAMLKIVDYCDEAGVNAKFVLEGEVPVRDKSGAYTVVVDDENDTEVALRIMREHCGLIVSKLPDEDDTKLSSTDKFRRAWEQPYLD